MSAEHERQRKDQDKRTEYRQRTKIKVRQASKVPQQ